jgi:hypothetical protein
MKVKEHHQKQQKKTFEENLSFQEWLDYFSKEPTTKELDEMEKQSKSTRRFYHPLNNTNYQPLQGA